MFSGFPLRKAQDILKPTNVERVVVVGIPNRKKGESGFTLVEVMLASAIGVLAFLVLFESLIVCQHLAAENKWRLAADGVAYDLTMDVFTRPVSWFENTNNYARLSGAVPKERASVWYPGGDVTFTQFVDATNVFPAASSVADGWVIRTCVQWPGFNGVTRSSPVYQVVRMRAKR